MLDLFLTEGAQESELTAIWLVSVTTERKERYRHLLLQSGKEVVRPSGDSKLAVPTLKS